MKNHIWIRIFVAGLIAMAVVAGTVESADNKPAAQKKFKFSDLFKKTNTNKTTKTNQTETKPAESCPSDFNF